MSSSTLAPLVPLGADALRLLDPEYGRHEEERRQKAWRLLLSLRPCSSMVHIEPLVQQVETLLAEPRGPSTDPDRDVASVIRHVFSGVERLAPVFADADFRADFRGLLGPD